MTNILILITTILFGSYDLLIKLSAQRNNPYLGAFIVQCASAITIGIILLKQSNKIPTTLNSISYPVIAGITIGLALILLFITLGIPNAKASIIIPSTLIGRNIVLILLSVIILKEVISPIQILGLTLSLIGITLINR